MRIILHRENGHIDYVGRKNDGDLCCVWCDSEPTHRVYWSGYRFGDLVCMAHAEKLEGYGAERVIPRHTLSSFDVGSRA